MSGPNTAQVVQDMFLEPNLEMCSINYTSTAMYVRYGYSNMEFKAAGIFGWL